MPGAKTASAISIIFATPTDKKGPIKKPSTTLTDTALSSELYYTILTALFTSLMWVTLILNRLAETGIWTALNNP
jgi:hypothetical protein